MIKATILVPTHDHGQTLAVSVQSALDQTVRETEIFIIGDGADEATLAAARELEKKDDRVRFFSHPKGPRHGEIYRHEALKSARGEIVCYLSDDDLWFPGHVEQMLACLKHADLAGALPLIVQTDGSLFMNSNIDFSDPHNRRAMLSGELSLMNLSCGAHTLSFYRKLPFGWRVTPAGIYTDLYMWQQFLSEPSCRASRAAMPTVLNFQASARKEMSAAARAAELSEWLEKVSSGSGRTEICDQALRLSVINGYGLARQLHAHAYSTTSRAKNALLSAPVAGRLFRWAATRARAKQ